jgi:hypothetical protein
MSAARLDLVVEQGADWTTKFTWHDSSGSAVDLTNYSARLKARPTKGSGTVLVNLTDGGGITLGGAAGTITLAVTAATTAAYDFLRAYYDLELVDAGGIVTRLIEGFLTLSKEVTY